MESLRLPSLETVHTAVANPKGETAEMFKLATISKMVPRMHIVDGEGLVLFPSAAYFPLSLATVCLMSESRRRANSVTERRHGGAAGGRLENG